MRRHFIAVLAAAACLVACGGPGPAPTQTAIVLVQGTSPLVTAAATAVPAVTEAPATLAATDTALPAPSPTVAATGTAAGLDAISADPLLRTYRSLVAIQMNAALVAETVRQVQAGRIDSEEMPVAALALGALTQSVDDGIPDVTPPPALAAQWQAALARHQEVKGLGARWLIGQANVAEVAASMDTIQAHLRQLLAEADAAVAAEYNVSAAELTEHRERLVEAVGGVFE